MTNGEKVKTLYEMGFIKPDLVKTENGIEVFRIWDRIDYACKYFARKDNKYSEFYATSENAISKIENS